VAKENFQKAQIWTHYRGIPILSDRRRQDSVEMIELYPTEMARNLAPAWLQYDKQVLCFEGYFREVVDDDVSAYQIRNMKISFFLDDGTVQVVEPKQVDSGIPQGCIVKRQKVPAGDLHIRKFLSVLDLNVGKPLLIFNRVYHITDCDEFTRNFLKQLGINVPPAQQVPTDPAMATRKRQSNVHIRRFGVKSNKLAQFLKNDGKVLRFMAFWDDSQSDFGYVRDLILLYYLADGTVEIIEMLPPSNGREETTTFLKRMKLPKKLESITDLDFQSSFTVLNVFGAGLTGGRLIPDSKASMDNSKDFITEKDLQIGKTLSVFGRNVVLSDCDTFTKNFYKEKYGIEEFVTVHKPLDQSMIAAKQPENDLPPFNGWGSYEDSEKNCKNLELKPSIENTKKFLQSKNEMLRFGAKLISRVKENGERTFIITYHLADDTISVYETPVRNSGFTGGQFLHRMQFFLPNQNLMASVRPKIFTPQHFYIGAKIQLSDHIFEILSADCHVFDYMEKNQNVFPYANVDTIMTKIRDAMRPHYKSFIAPYIPRLAMNNNHGGLTASFELMQEMLVNLLKQNINPHEILTICRYFDNSTESSIKDRGSVVDWNKFISYIDLEDNLRQETD
uniref:Putative ef-hand domain-containing family member c2 n=1 Tax=Lutzomyia longipalpis TaxID=7200 RepID=A0A1B0EV89_LUTLO